MQELTAKPIEVSIFIAGDVADAKRVCRDYCFDLSYCVFVSEGSYIYKGGQEEGVRVTLINYARFPEDLDIILAHARELGDRLMTGCHQNSYTILSPVGSTFYSRRTT